MEVVAQTLQFALRSLTKRPSFALTVVLTLALGIGANTAIFSILHALVLRNLPVAEPDRLVVVSRNQLSLPYPLFRHFQDRATTFDGVLAFRTAPWRFSSGESTERITGVLVSGSYFGVLGVRAAIGTTIRHEDDVTPGSGGDRGPVAVLSYGFWQSRFAGRPSAIRGVGCPQRTAVHDCWRSSSRFQRNGSRPDSRRLRPDDHAIRLAPASATPWHSRATTGCA